MKAALHIQNRIVLLAMSAAEWFSGKCERRHVLLTDRILERKFNEQLKKLREYGRRR